MKIVQIIPARMGSSRFPGKPLKKINGIPMIEMIYKNIFKIKEIYKTYVATCDKEIFDYLKSKKINVIYTSKKHQRASDRCAEALFKLEKKYNIRFDLMVMVQGDEPLINYKNIKSAIKPFKKNKSLQVVNLMSKIIDKPLISDPNCVKVVFNKHNYASYFSRSAIPYSKEKNTYSFKQVCVIPFTRSGIIKYMKLKSTMLEKIESIDMLRFIENDIKIQMVEIKNYTHPVDNLSDLKKVENYLRNL